MHVIITPFEEIKSIHDDPGDERAVVRLLRYGKSTVYSITAFPTPKGALSCSGQINQAYKALGLEDVFTLREFKRLLLRGRKCV